jgi:hypothetical protein
MRMWTLNSCSHPFYTRSNGARFNTCHSIAHGAQQHVNLHINKLLFPHTSLCFPSTSLPVNALRVIKKQVTIFQERLMNDKRNKIENVFL